MKLMKDNMQQKDILKTIKLGKGKYSKQLTGKKSVLEFMIKRTQDMEEISTKLLMRLMTL